MTVSLVALDATNAATTATLRAESAAETHEYERAEVWAAIATANATLAIAVRLTDVIATLDALALTIAEQGPR